MPAVRPDRRGGACLAPGDPEVAAPRPPVLVMAVGNILRQDDGFADAVLRELEERALPASVELFDAGTSAIDLMGVFAGRERLLVIDAVRGGRAPGTLYRFSPEDVDAGALPMNSLHQVGLLETLKLGELVDCRPRQTVVIGVQPAQTGLGIGLTPAVADAVEQAVTLVLEEIETVEPGARSQEPEARSQENPLLDSEF